MKTTLSAISLIFILAGCSDDGGSDDPTLRTGQLLYSGIDGLSYQTATLEGKVNKDGRFTYRTGETVAFWLGDVPLAEGVPAKEFITPMEFTVNGRSRLETGDVINGFSTHKVAEEEVAAYQYQNNLTRFLQLMDVNLEPENILNQAITISDRSIEQMNTQLLTLSPPLDFDIPISKFEENTAKPVFVDGECPADGVTAETPVVPPTDSKNKKSTVNILLDEICFFQEGDIRCEAPPTQAEIDCAPNKFDEDGNLLEGIDESLVSYYKEDLKNQWNAIINSGTSTTLKSSDSTKELIIYESSLIYKETGARIFFSQYDDTVKEGDVAQRTISIHSEDSGFVISAMEVESQNDRIARVDGFSETGKTFSYSPVGVSGEETTIFLNIKLEGDYRWYRKNYRIIIE